MASFGYYDDEMVNMLPPGMLPPGMMRRAAASGPRRFDEYYRCYPVTMLPGPERDNVNHGGKVIMPPSALDQLTRLHITYPMLFELINGDKDTMTHAGVLEFIAEEGKIYLPFWMMQTLNLTLGDLLQIKSTDLPPGSFIKLQAQSPSFLDISDPKAVLENAFRDYSCLTRGDTFTFNYNESTYEMAVLETKPDVAMKGAIGVLETDLEVDFAAPVGYEEPKRVSGTSTPRTGGTGLPNGGMLRNQGTMAQAINYDSIAPQSATTTDGTKPISTHFLVGGQKLNARKNSKAPPSTTTSTPQPNPVRRGNGPQPLRLPPGKLFFGYEVKPVRKAGAKKPETDESKPRFQGQGQTLRGGTKRKDADGGEKGIDGKKDTDKAEGKDERKEGGLMGGKGRTLRDTPK